MSIAHRKLVRFAEYAAVSASVVGAIATITTRQPAYAVAPLSISATLSLISRHQRSQQLDESIREDSQTTQDVTVQIQQIEQHLDTVEQQELSRKEEIRSLSDTVTQQRTQAETAAQIVEILQNDLLNQGQKLAAIENGRDHSDAAFEALRSDLLEQKQKLTAIESGRSQGTVVTTSLTESLEKTKLYIETALANMQSAFEALSRQVAETQALQKEQTKAQQSNTQQIATAQEVSQLEREIGMRISKLSVDIKSLRTDLETIALQLSKQTIEQEASEDETEKAGNASDFSHLVPQLPTNDDFDLDINLGIDFGTGYTKVCLRDLALERAEVVTFANLTDAKLNLDKTLMPTRLAILEDETLLTGLTVEEWQKCDRPIRQNIDYIKMRLAAIDLGKEDPDSQQDEWRLEQIPELNDDETVKSLCAYYLSQVIVRAQQWAIQNRPEIFANRSVRWSVNLGVPVEYCDSQALKTFEKVLAIAWLIRSTDIDVSTLTINRLNRLTTHLEQWASTDEQIRRLDCTTTPEIVAAMWSFINSRQAKEGFYTFFDIGDGTLDGAAFVFNRTDGSRKVDCYIGKVEPLGVSAFVEKTADELQLTLQSVRKSLSDTSNTTLNNQIQKSSTRKKVQKMIAKVVIEGNEKHQQIRKFSVEEDIGENLKVFVGGGGGNTEFFPNTIEATHSDFKQGNAGIPPYKLRPIPTPDDLSVNGLEEKDFNRFAIAYGLCIPEGENPEIRLPSQFQTIEPGSEISYHTPEKYEDSRDLM